MRQFTTPDQTATLIELGFEKPSPKWVKDENGDYRVKTNDADYDIGELIEILLPNPHCRVSIYNVGFKQHKVLFKKLINGRFKVLFREVGYEPIDLLFNCIVKLKEEGVI